MFNVGVRQPFLLRATPQLDLAGWSLRSEVNLDGRLSRRLLK